MAEIGWDDPLAVFSSRSANAPRRARRALGPGEPPERDGAQRGAAVRQAADADAACGRCAAARGGVPGDGGGDRALIAARWWPGAAGAQPGMAARAAERGCGVRAAHRFGRRAKAALDGHRGWANAQNGRRRSSCGVLFVPAKAFAHVGGLPGQRRTSGR